MSRFAYALPMLLMLFLGVLTLWLRQAIETPGEPRSTVARHEPDAVVERLLVTRLGVDGRPETTLSARRMVHFADDKDTQLESPQLVRSRGGAKLSVSADRGIVSADYREARFYERVQLTRAEQGDGEELNVRTDYLLVLIDEEELRTDRPVTIVQGESTISGVGMEYSRKNGRIALLSDVKASFPPRPSRGRS